MLGYTMKVGIFASTPAQIHFYKNIISELNKRGHSTVLLARNYGENLKLLEEYGMDHYIFSNPPESKWGKIANLPFDVMNAIKYLKRNRIDIITGFGIYEAFTSAILRKPAITFCDSEYTINKLSLQIQLILLSPFVDVIITPSWYRQDLGPKQIKINSFKELAYLHPNYFKPRSDVIDLLGYLAEKPYILFRFNNFDAVHDMGITGFTIEDKIKLVKELKTDADIFISSEGKIVEELQKYVIKIPKNRIHDVIYYAEILITDTQTMATEAAILGTPTIRCNKFVGENDMGNFIELEKRYSLIYNVKNSDQVLEIARKLLKTPDLKRIYQLRRDRLLNETIDIASFFTQFIENYPNNLQQFKRNKKK
jgi:uncharacterized protein